MKQGTSFRNRILFSHISSPPFLFVIITILLSLIENTSSDSNIQNIFCELVTENVNWPPNWICNTPYCEFSGIDCSDGLSISIVDIDLQNLTGDALARLPFTKIQCTRCNLLHLLNLQHLNLTELIITENPIEATLPKWIGNTTTLKKLNLEKCMYHGPIPDYSSLKDLTYLSLNKNNLDGDIPTWLTSLTLLKYIDLGHNRFSGNFFNGQIESLKDLTHLDMSTLDSLSSGPIPEGLYELTHLIHLDIEKTNRVGIFSSGIGNLVSLDTFEAHDNYFTGEVPLEFYNLTKLINIDIHGNNLSGQFRFDLLRSYGLEKIDIGRNYFSGTIHTAIGQFTYLTSLTVEHNFLEGTLPTQVGDIRNLIYLRINSNNLTGVIPIEIGDNFQLHELHMEINGFSGLVPSQLGNLQNVRELYIHKNYLSPPLPFDLIQLICNDNTIFQENLGDLSYNCSSLIIGDQPSPSPESQPLIISSVVIVNETYNLGGIETTFNTGGQLVVEGDIIFNDLSKVTMELTNPNSPKITTTSCVYFSGTLKIENENLDTGEEYIIMNYTCSYGQFDNLETSLLCPKLSYKSTGLVFSHNNCDEKSSILGTLISLGVVAFLLLLIIIILVIIFFTPVHKRIFPHSKTYHEMKDSP